MRRPYVKAVAKGRKAADDPAATEASCPFKNYEHRKSWMFAFRARRKELAATPPAQLRLPYKD